MKRMKRREFIERAKRGPATVQVISEELAEHQADLAEEAGVRWDSEEPPKPKPPRRVKLLRGSGAVAVNPDQRFDVLAREGAHGNLLGEDLDEISATQAEAGARYNAVERFLNECQTGGITGAIVLLKRLLDEEREDLR